MGFIPGGRGEMDWPDQELLAIAFALAAGAAGLTASAHALLYKRRPRAAFGWIAVCLTFPLAGAILYLLFGVNRAERRAHKLRTDGEPSSSPAGFAVAAPESLESLTALAALGERVSGQPLVGGNAIEPLFGGEQAYSAMLAAIDGARQRVFLSTYIFDSDVTGRAFSDALGRAMERGVDVRVVLDGVGELYTFPRARRLLRRRGVSVLRFLPPRLLPPCFMLNLRNHRKILVVDDEIAFTGGMNISDRHLLAEPRSRRRVVDIHFAVQGPVTAVLQDIFESDWVFAGGGAESTPPQARRSGSALCRAIADGPDEPLDRLRLLMVGAVGLARERVALMTPYFIPPRELLVSLQAAALRGVDVSILLPGHSNLFFVHRATRHLLWELLERGVRVFYQPGPFVHSKLLLIDDDYAQVGSANVDPRSLRLNFELNIEVYDRAFVARLSKHFTTARAAAQEVHLADVDGRRVSTRLADGLAWLFSPYL